MFRSSVVMLVLVVVVSTMSLGQDSEASGELVRQMPEADFDPLEGLAGVPGSVAYVEGIPLEEVGADIWMRDGYAVWDDEASSDPILRVAELQGIQLFDETLSESHQQLLKKTSIDLYHSNGVLEIGRPYGFFLGVWDDTNLSFLYAHDLLSDRPAPGFLTPETEVVIEELSTTSSADTRVADVGESNLASVMELAMAESEPEAISETDAPPDGYFPQFESELEELQAFRSTDVAGVQATAAAPEQYAEVDGIVLLPDNLSGRFGLRSKADGRILGWFENSDGSTPFVLITGYVPASEKFELVRQAGRKIRRVNMRKYGLRKNFIVLDSQTGYVGFLIDLAGSQLETLSTYSSVAEWDAAVRELGPLN